MCQTCLKEYSLIIFIDITRKYIYKNKIKNPSIYTRFFLTIGDPINKEKRLLYNC